MSPIRQVASLCLINHDDRYQHGLAFLFHFFPIPLSQKLGPIMKETKSSRNRHFYAQQSLTLHLSSTVSLSHKKLIEINIIKPTTLHGNVCTLSTYNKNLNYLFMGLLLLLDSKLWMGFLFSFSNSEFEHISWNQISTVQILALPLTSCVTSVSSLGNCKDQDHSNTNQHGYQENYMNKCSIKVPNIQHHAFHSAGLQ